MADPAHRIAPRLRVRRPVQLITAFLLNARFLFDARSVCFPALNCWACPTASVACPLGALQNALGDMRLGGPLPIYVLGSMVAISAVIGRSMCGWLCPFGLFQDLLARLRRRHLKLPAWTGYGKYVMLVGLAIILPYLTSVPWFCKFCPQGTLQGGIPQPLLYAELRALIGGWWFLKVGILAAFVVASIFFRRPFCRSFCALGAIFSLFNRISLIRMHFSPEKCVDCMWCVRVCPAGIDPRTELGGMNCVQCMKCAGCPYHAIHVTTACSREERDGEASA
ncbi:MAG: 4Fe-4S binding protein [Armatimonadota bacterium]